MHVLIIRKNLTKIVDIGNWSNEELEKFIKAYSEEKGYEIQNIRL